MSTDLPAILGGTPAANPALPFSRPAVADEEAILDDMRQVLRSGHFTDGPFGRRLEEQAADRFGVVHAVAVNSCTSGLMLSLQALGLSGEVIVPSFTFSASGHAVRWNGLQARFADCDRGTFCLRPEDVRAADRGRTAAILAVHVSGVPADVVGLAKAASDIGVPHGYDAAHGAGSSIALESGDVPLGGFGLFEVFSLTPTKVLNGAEGGLVTTNDATVAQHVRLGRNYGNPGDYDPAFPGINGRMSEPHAVLALHALAHIDEWVDARNALAARYRKGLGEIPGIGFQTVPEGARSTVKDFTIVVDADGLGCSRDALAKALKADGVDTRKYYAPPMHRQKAYLDADAPPALPNTQWLASRVLTLPIWSTMPAAAVDTVVGAIARIHANADRVEAAAVA